MRFPLRPTISEVAAIRSLPPLSPVPTTTMTTTTTTTNDNNNMATTRNRRSGQIANNDGPPEDPDGQGRGQAAKLLAPGFASPSQLASDSDARASDKAATTTTTTTHNNNSNASNSSSSSNITTTNCTNSVLAAVTKVVSSSDDEQEAFLAEIDSDLPNFLSRTFMGQDARFSFILFFTVFSFSLVLGLFVIQASYAWHNYQLLEMLGREDFSEEFFYLHYYDPPEPLTDESPSPGLRVNTSFYVH